MMRDEEKTLQINESQMNNPQREDSQLNKLQIKDSIIDYNKEKMDLV